MQKRGKDGNCYLMAGRKMAGTFIITNRTDLPGKYLIILYILMYPLRMAGRQSAGEILSPKKNLTASISSWNGKWIKAETAALCFMYRNQQHMSIHGTQARKCNCLTMPRTLMQISINAAPAIYMI